MRRNEQPARRSNDRQRSFFTQTGSPAGCVRYKRLNPRMTSTISLRIWCGIDHGAVLDNSAELMQLGAAPSIRALLHF